LVCKPIETPLVRFGRRGELRTAGSNARVNVTHVNGEAEEKSRIMNKILKLRKGNGGTAY
jgi:hypothetical protein